MSFRDICRRKVDEDGNEQSSRSGKRQRLSTSPAHSSASSPPSSASFSSSSSHPASSSSPPSIPPCFSMLATGSCSTSNCSAHHCMYGAAIKSYISCERPARLPEPLDGLTSIFRPSLFDVASQSPFHSATAASHLPTERRSTAVLPLPITRQLLHVYHSPTFLTKLLSLSGLSHSDVRLMIAVDERVAPSMSCLYGFVLLSGPLRAVQRAIDAVIGAVEDATGPQPPPTTSTPPLSSSASRSPVVQMCPWQFFGPIGCFRRRCPLPDESHGPYIQHLIRHIDTTPRPLSAIPAFCSNFTFVVCRSPSADSLHYLCSLCVPNTGRVRGYVVGYRGRTHQVIENEVGEAVICNRGTIDATAEWVTITTVGDLTTIDTLVEATMFLHETNDAPVTQIAQHLQQWKQQRAARVDRPMLLSLHSRGAHSPQLDSLFGRSPMVPRTLTVSQPVVQSDSRRREHAQQTQVRRSYSPLTSTVDPSEPCPLFLLSGDCNDPNCRLSHNPNKSYAAWLAERLCCRHDHMKQLPFFSHDFIGILSDDSGLPAQPLLVALPIPSMILPNKPLRSSGPLVEKLQHQLKVFVNPPRTEQEPPGLFRPWGLIRLRGDARQIDAVIEWCCQLMDDWKTLRHNIDLPHGKQQGQAKSLTEHIERWLKWRAEYVAEHGEVFYSFVSRGLGAHVRLTFPLPAAAVEGAPPTSTSSRSTMKDAPPVVHDRSDKSSPTRFAASRGSLNTSTSSQSSHSTEEAASPAAHKRSGHSSLSHSPTSSANLNTSTSSTTSSRSSSSHDSSSTSLPRPPPASATTSSPPQSTPPSPPLDHVLLLESMRATGRLLAYTSYVQHPSFSATAQPFIRQLPDQLFGCWPIPTGSRETFVWTMDEQALPLSLFEEKWGVDVFAPTVVASSGSSVGSEWCNVCVRMKLGKGEGALDDEMDGAVAKANENRASDSMDAVMLAVVQRAKRIEQLVRKAAQ